MDFGEVNADFVDLQCFPEMIYGYDRACDTEPLFLEFAIVDVYGDWEFHMNPALVVVCVCGIIYLVVMLNFAFIERKALEGWTMPISHI